MSVNKKKKIIRFSLLGLGVALIVIQFIRPDRSTPEMVPSDDFIAQAQPPAEIETLLRDACYDCHSYETAWPWYTNIAPVSWWISKHIRHGRKHLNFSEWGTYESDRKDHKVEECIEYVEEGWMPLNSYTWMHGNAKLSEKDRRALTDWFKTL